jgi:hypothetical protein
MEARRYGTEWVKERKEEIILHVSFGWCHVTVVERQFCIF